jgi:CHAD domain-containing protein
MKTMEADRLQKPVRTLRKGLKSLPKDPAPQQVHKLRIGARQMESVAAALLPANGNKARQLLKTIKPLRKAAGRVRDMDVLTGNALKLARVPGRDSLARLVKYLGSKRQKNTDKLVDAVEHRRKAARRRLKQFEKRVESALKAGDSGVRAVQLEGGVRAATENLRGDLSRWPELGADNIHRFRLKIKELRSLLQLERDSDAGFVRALGNAKNKIGEWHDWQQLSEIAREILHSQEDRPLLVEIDDVVKRRLEEALTASNSLRRKYLKPILIFKKTG